MQLRNLKSDNEMRHDKEVDYIRDRFRNKHQLVMDRIQEENKSLIEQSTDIDQHVLMFRKDMINNKTDEEKYKIEDELRKKIKEQRAQNNK